jgi:hypothetical protein
MVVVEGETAATVVYSRRTTIVDNLFSNPNLKLSRKKLVVKSSCPREHGDSFSKSHYVPFPNRFLAVVPIQIISTPIGRTFFLPLSSM